MIWFEEARYISKIVALKSHKKNLETILQKYVEKKKAFNF